VSSPTDPSPPARRICVFCGSNTGADAVFTEAARDLGTSLADHGFGLVYGGGRVGLMGVVADAALAGGAEVIGVMPAHLVDREIGHRGLTALEVTESMHERKARMAELADGFLVLPGGFGTYEEAIEVLTWNQLGLMTKPVVFVDVAGFYAPLMDFFDAAVRAGFVRDSHRALVQLARTPAEALEMVAREAPITEHKWIDLDRT
jgi:uncharacterized protein (TIGR00730 family)